MSQALPIFRTVNRCGLAGKAIHIVHNCIALALPIMQFALIVQCSFRALSFWQRIGLAGSATFQCQGRSAKSAHHSTSQNFVKWTMGILVNSKWKKHKNWKHVASNVWTLHMVFVELRFKSHRVQGGENCDVELHLSIGDCR